MTPQPTDAQRVEWLGRLAAAVTTGREALIDAIFAAGVEAAQAGMTVEWGVRPPEHLPNQAFPFPDEESARLRVEHFPVLTVVTRRVTDWQSTP